MASSKRDLYRPASGSSTPLGKKKKRKPLVQGMLVTNTEGDYINLDTSTAGGSLHSSFNSGTEADPILSPRRFIPQLTEESSPRPEPPSANLDLSDVELGLKDASARSKRNPVMVYDATSNDSSSQHSCEVALSVAVEASPARVVCHTPTSLHHKVGSTPRQQRSQLAETADVQSFRGLNSSSKKDGLSRVLFPDEDEAADIQAENNPSKDGSSVGISDILMQSSNSSMHISHKSRGIIEEILANEIGDSHAKAASISNQSLSMAEVLKSNPPFTNSSTEMVSLPNQSSSIVAENLSKENAKSDSLESSQVRMKRKKKAPREVASRYMQSSSMSTRSRQGSANVSMVSLTKNESNNSSVKGKVSVGVKATSYANIHGRGVVRKTGAIRTGTTLVRPGVRSAAGASKEQKQFNVQGEAVGGGSGDSRKTSTPVRDQTSSALPSYLEASTILKGHSNVHLMETVLRDGSSDGSNSTNDRSKGKTGSTRGAGDGGEAHHVTQRDLDLAYTRYLQWNFMVGQMRTTFEKQERSAAAQIHGVWQLVQEEEQKVAQLQLDVARLKTVNELDCILEETEKELAPLLATLPQLRDDLDQMASALDNTCHQLPVFGVHLPSGGAAAIEALEERLAQNLARSEKLLAEINHTASNGNPKVLNSFSKYNEGLEDVSGTGEATLQELSKCRLDLNELSQVNNQLASLMVQDMQTSGL